MEGCFGINSTRKGTNNLVEKHRSLKSKLLELPEVLDSDDEDVVKAYIDSIGTDIALPTELMEQLNIINECDND